MLLHDPPAAPPQCNKGFQFRNGTCSPKGAAVDPCAANPCGANGECKAEDDGTFECKVGASPQALLVLASPCSVPC